MSAVRLMYLALSFLFVSAAVAGAQDAQPDTGYSMRFQCPESLWTRWGRDRADMRFITWAQEPPREWRVDQLLAYRMGLLRAHGCNETLDAIENGTVESQVEAEVTSERRAVIILLGGGALTLGFVSQRRRDGRRQQG